MKREKSARFLEVTYRNGQPWVAYLQLERGPGQRPVRTRKEERGLIKITAPRLVNLADVNHLLKQLGVSPITKAEFAPLVAA